MSLLCEILPVVQMFDCLYSGKTTKKEWFCKINISQLLKLAARLMKVTALLESVNINLTPCLSSDKGSALSQ